MSFSLSKLLKSEFASRRILRIATLPPSASPRTTFTKSLRRSSVNGGNGIRISVPLDCGFKPKSDFMIAFSTALIMPLSKTVIDKFRASGTEILPT